MHALVLLINGFEDMEAVAPMDILRRAGWTVTGASVDGSSPLTASNGLRMVPDTALSETQVDRMDLLIIPGGPGSKALRENAAALECVRRFDSAGKPIAAICAGPAVLLDAGILGGRTVTSHPVVAGEIQSAGVRWVDDPVCVDDRIFTAQGAGLAVDFALEIVRRLNGPATADRVAGSLRLRR
ncbi:MAG: DJ-1/PfpI family protein [Kiritimatiellae bacterium]|nr:DJ-1/PfpI family protein [Kiritimatiellia bacterium]